MTRDVVLTDVAIRRLDEIREWTETRFGGRQASTYLDLIEERIASLAAGRIEPRSAAVLSQRLEDTEFQLVRA